jgi:hypothetical protein
MHLPSTQTGEMPIATHGGISNEHIEQFAAAHAWSCAVTLALEATLTTHAVQESPHAVSERTTQSESVAHAVAASELVAVASCDS